MQIVIWENCLIGKECTQRLWRECGWTDVAGQMYGWHIQFTGSTTSQIESISCAISPLIRASRKHQSPPDDVMSTPLPALEHIEMLSTFSPNRGERMWIQDTLDGWEDGYPRLTPLLSHPLPPFPGLEVFFPIEGKMVGMIYIPSINNTPTERNTSPRQKWADCTSRSFEDAMRAFETVKPNKHPSPV